MTRISLALIAALGALLMPVHTALGAECKDGCKISSIQPYGGSPGTLIYVSGGTWVSGTCGSTESERRFLIDATKEPRAKELLAVAMISFASSSNVFIKGNGSCPYFSIEEVLFIKAEK